MIQRLPIGPFHIYADPDDGTGHLFTEQGLDYEPHIQAELKRLLPACTGFLDIGANVGFHTMLVKSLRRSIPVISIEVHPETAQLLARAVAECALEGVTILPLAVAHNCHVVQIDAHNSNAVCAVLGSWPFNTPHARFAPCITLDTLDLRHINLVKMDIDGGEYLALHGATHLLAQRPTIVFEYHLGVVARSGIKGPELLHYLTQRGYQLTVLNFPPSHPVIRRTFTSADACHKYVLATTGLAVDILAEPL